MATSVYHFIFLYLLGGVSSLVDRLNEGPAAESLCGEGHPQDLQDALQMLQLVRCVRLRVLLLETLSQLFDFFLVE